VPLSSRPVRRFDVWTLRLKLQIISAVAGIVGAILGAALGAVGTYTASHYLTKAERTTRLLTILRMLFRELSSHLGILWNEVDAFLPAWLQRNDELRNEPKIISSHFKPDRLDDKCYRQFFPDLIHCDLIDMFADYYSSAERLNRLKPEAKTYTQREMIFDYAGLCAGLLAANIELASRMDSEYKLTQTFPVLLNYMLADRDSVFRGRYMAELCDFKVTDLERLQWHLDKGYMPKEGSHDWVKLRRLPDLIKGDMNRL
jgi:hypothetical protein